MTDELEQLVNDLLNIHNRRADLQKEFTALMDTQRSLDKQHYAVIDKMTTYKVEQATKSKDNKDE